MDEAVRRAFEGADYPKLSFVPSHGAVIVDLGANVGGSAILFSARYPNAAVYALEPAKEAFDLLARNTIPFSNIHGFQFGAFDRDTAANLYHGDCGPHTNSLFAGGLASETPGEVVTLRRISSFLREQKISHVDVLKIDTEGAEVAILRDLIDYFPHVDAIHVEYHSEADRLEIDRLLTPLFILSMGKIVEPHRGTLTYVAKTVTGPNIRLDAMKIHTDRPVGLG
jgi:FkbM family methyltransferase